MILVTGGTGFVGSHLLFDLIKSGKKVRALKRENSNVEQVLTTFSYYSDNANKLFEQIEWVTGDVLDIFSLENALKGVTDVYHTAAFLSFSRINGKKMQRINVEGTRNLVNMCLELPIRKLCFVSSIAALGNSKNNDNIITENTTWSLENNSSAYSVSKFNSELEVWRGINEGLKAVIVNPSVILGPGQWDKGSPRLFSKIAKGFKFFTRGVTGYVDVKDVSQVMIFLMESDIENERFILNSENCSFEYVFKTIAKELGLKTSFKYVPPFFTEIGWRIAYLKKMFLLGASEFNKEIARAIHTKKYYSNKKIKDVIDFEFISIEQSIRDTVKHYKKAKGFN